VLHRTGWIGGGDIKLALAIAVLVGYPRAVTFLLCTGSAGGVLALGIALARRRGTMLVGQVRSALIAAAAGNAQVTPIAAAPIDERIPYACAIAAGLAITLLLPLFGPARFGS
jgi:prepilin peptidase CpaA